MFERRQHNTGGRRINIGDSLRYIGNEIDSVKYGRVTPGKVYTSVGRHGPNIFIENNVGEISFKYNLFEFADKG